jgi:hypothetical protein
MPMNLEEAVKLIINEAHKSDGSLSAVIRTGADPGAQRMHDLISAIKIVFHALEGHGDLDRRLAAALFTLGSDIPLMVSHQANQGQQWRKGFMEDEIYQMLMGLQSIFEDRWLGPVESETIH